MIKSKPKKKVLKRKNPLSEFDLNNLLGKPVQIVSKYSTFSGILFQDYDYTTVTIYTVDVIKDKNIQNTPAKLRDINIIVNKINTLKGEELNRPFDFNVIVH